MLHAMKRTNIQRIWTCLWLAAAVLMHSGLHAQTYISVNMPKDVCVGTSTLITIGFSDTCTTVIGVAPTTLGHNDRVFLPDGVECDLYGCSYRSSVDFEAFLPGATVTSVEDIRYVRLKIEHSFIGDLYMGIVCPNGQQASLMN